MRHQIGQHGIGGRNESWYYVEYDEATDEVFYVHEWHNLDYQLKTNEGEKKTPILEAKDFQYYRHAANWVREKIPAWKNVDQL